MIVFQGNLDKIVSKLLTERVFTEHANSNKTAEYVRDIFLEVDEGRREQTYVRVIVNTDHHIRVYNAHHEFNVDGGQIRLPWSADSTDMTSVQTLLNDINAFVNAGYSITDQFRLYLIRSGSFMNISGYRYDTDTNVVYLFVGNADECDEFVTSLAAILGNDHSVDNIESELTTIVSDDEIYSAWGRLCVASLPDSCITRHGISGDVIAQLRSEDWDVDDEDDDNSNGQADNATPDNAPDDPSDDFDDELTLGDDAILVRDEPDATQPDQGHPDEQPEQNPPQQNAGRQVAGMQYLGMFDPDEVTIDDTFQIVFGSTTVEDFQAFVQRHAGIVAGLHPTKPYMYFKYRVDSPTGFSKRVPYMSYMLTDRTFTIVDVIRGKHVTVYEVHGVGTATFLDEMLTQDVRSWGDQIVWRRIREPAYKTSTTGITVTYDADNFYREAVGVNVPCPFTVGLAVPRAQNATPVEGAAPAVQAARQAAQRRRGAQRNDPRAEAEAVNSQIQTAIAGTDLALASAKFVPPNLRGPLRPRGLAASANPILYIEFPGVNPTAYRGTAAQEFLQSTDMWDNGGEAAFDLVHETYPNVELVVSLNGRTFVR